MCKTLMAVVLTLVMLVAVGGAATAPDDKPAAPPPMKIKVGDMAPDFTLLAFDGKELKKVALRDYRGKKNVALAFYVFAFGGTWTKEMKAFQQNISKLEAADTQVLGVSMDSPFSNFNFAQQNGVSFPLLSDRDGNVTKE